MARTASTKKATAGATILEFDTEAIKAREAEVAQETDEEIYERLAERFMILDEMTKAVKTGDVRAMIVSGPPGVGKSFGVEAVLNKDSLFDKLAERKPKFEVVKGTASAVGLYAKLYEFSAKGNVIVFDDCDSLFFDDTCLNLLKAALDTSDRRWISWNTDSRLLRSEGIPDRFEFRGSVIFISNIKFAHVRSKRLKDHLTALESRCHYIDLEMDTQREKILRIKQVIREKKMLASYDLESGAQEELIDYIESNKDSLRELSLRTVIKAADLRKSFPNSWKTMAKTTLMRR
jgi:hypothetical protein